MKKIIKNTLFTLVTITWGLPLVVIGVFYLLYSIIFRRIIKVRYINGRFALTTLDDIGGVSFGLFYFVGDFDSLDIHYHEIGHTVQNLLWGPLFIFVIGLPSIVRAGFWDKMQDRHYKKYNRYKGYDDIWYEGQATRWGKKYFIDRHSDYYKYFQIN